MKELHRYIDRFRASTEPELEIKQLLERSSWNTAPELDRRLSEHEQRKGTLRDGEEMYSSRSGFYTTRFNWSNQPTITKVEAGVELGDIEVFLHEQIGNTLLQKKKDADPSPVVVMDFGGMYGGSLLKLAATMNDLVSSQQVVFVVTNLSFQPSYRKCKQDVKLNFVPLELAGLFKNKPKQVRYITADARELLTQNIKLSRDKKFPLLGNVDILHEDLALTFGIINDIDLPMMASLLSKFGTFFLGTTKYLERDVGDTPYDDRVEAHKIGLTNLHSYGLQEMDPDIQLERYSIYTRPSSPHLSVDTK